MLAWIEQDRSGRGRGFAMLGFYCEDISPRRQVVADLLALAVLPNFQRTGIGTRLLHHAIDAAERIVPGPAMLRLTVAEHNRGAQRLYARHAFAVVDGTATYDRGQRALRMVRALKRAG